MTFETNIFIVDKTVYFNGSKKFHDRNPAYNKWTSQNSIMIVTFPNETKNMFYLFAILTLIYLEHSFQGHQPSQTVYQLKAKLTF